MTNGYLVEVFIAFVVIQNVQTQSRLVVNTTCLELAKPSNQQHRLICSQHDYHCLLDESYTQEFEVCREWKWIPGGKCAYFNTYGSGNVDERECKPGINLTCSESKHQFESKTNIQFTACYAKRGSSTSLFTTTSAVQVSLNMTSKRDIATSYPSSKAWIVFLLYIIAALLSIFAILFILRFFRKDYNDEIQRGDEENVVDGTLCICFVPMKSNAEEMFFDALEEMPPPDATDEIPITNKENSLESTSDSGLNQVVTNAVNDEEESTDVSDETVENLQRISPPTENTDTQDSLRSIEQPTYAIDERLIRNNENSLESTSDSGLNQVVTNAVNDEEESTDVFDDTVESLQRISPPTDDEERKLCTSLNKLLNDEGVKLSHEAMAAIITKVTGKSIKELVADKIVQNKVKGVLDEDLHHLVTTENLSEKSIFVSYGLLQIYVNKDHHPKSGWGIPVRETDFGIGDDIERLYRIQTIVRRISDPVKLSIESYIRLLDIMVNALSRLYPDVKFKEGFKSVVYKLTDIKHPNMTNTIFKKLFEMKKLLPW